ncbi:uncharacterized protein [Capricornis sumatraensis]|uniref:uncharacterized protein n=1 Tax=Capricornis sumatraensis TaxID=34865 RepID=UPI0036051283
MVEIIATDQNTEKRMKRNEVSLRDLWDNIKHTICSIGVLEGEEREKGLEKIFEETSGGGQGAAVPPQAVQGLQRSDQPKPRQSSHGAALADGLLSQENPPPPPCLFPPHPHWDPCRPWPPFSLGPGPLPISRSPTPPPPPPPPSFLRSGRSRTSRVPTFFLTPKGVQSIPASPRPSDQVVTGHSLLRDPRRSRLPRNLPLTRTGRRSVSQTRPARRPEGPAGLTRLGPAPQPTLPHYELLRRSRAALPPAQSVRTRRRRRPRPGPGPGRAGPAVEGPLPLASASGAPKWRFHSHPPRRLPDLRPALSELTCSCSQPTPALLPLYLGRQ